MAAAASQIAKDCRGPAIRFQGLMWPVIDHAFDHVSYDTFAKGYFLSRDMMKWFWNACTIDEGEAYGYRLDQAGNDVTTTQHKGTIHDFGLLNELAADAPTRAAMQQMATALKTHLQ